jgi:SsrA-binding protein
MSIVENRKAFHDYFVEERYEAGLVLAGWGVKAIRAGRAQIGDAYVIVDEGALWLIGAHISPAVRPRRTSRTRPAPASSCCAPRRSGA